MQTPKPGGWPIVGDTELEPGVETPNGFNKSGENLTFKEVKHC